MFQIKRLVGVKYEQRGERWYLMDRIVDPGVADLVGREMSEYPLIVEPPSHPQRFLGKILLVLARHNLDGGFIHEKWGDHCYSATISVEGRREKPQS